MEITYMMIGADGRQYGPISLEQLKAWIAERRITPETNILRSDTNSWLPAANYVELGLVQPAAAPMAPSAAAARGFISPAVAPAVNPLLLRQLRSGSGWFFFIAGLSLINSIIGLTGGGLRFVIGLGVTRLIDDLGAGIPGSGTVISLGLDLVVVAIFIVVGVFARKGQAWAFIVGMVLYALDCGLLIVHGATVGVYDWFSIGFHAFALYCIFLGLRASIRIGASGAGTAAQGR